MFLKLAITLTVVLILFALFYPRKIPRLFRWLGRSLGDAARAGGEMLTGEEVKNSPLARYEVRAGDLVAKKVLAEHPVLAEAELQEYVANVGDRLAQHASRKEIPYRFNVVVGHEPNAYAVAGGAIFVTKPLIDLCRKDVSCLAGVLGHEIIHIDERHALKSLVRSAAVKGGIRLFSFGRGFLLSQVASAMQTLLVQGYRQEQELEADLLGSHLVLKAGYPGQGLTRLLENLEGERPDAAEPVSEAWGYFQSHPPLRTRIEHLRRAKL